MIKIFNDLNPKYLAEVIQFKKIEENPDLPQKLEEILKKQGILNVNACIAYPQKEDPYLTKDSVFFHEKSGYSMVGKFHACGYKFNRWYDMVWMEKMIGEHLEKQPAIIPFLEIEYTVDADLI